MAKLIKKEVYICENDNCQREINQEYKYCFVCEKIFKLEKQRQCTHNFIDNIRVKIALEAGDFEMDQNDLQLVNDLQCSLCGKITFKIVDEIDLIDLNNISEKDYYTIKKIIERKE